MPQAFLRKYSSLGSLGAAGLSDFSLWELGTSSLTQGLLFMGLMDQTQEVTIRQRTCGPCLVLSTNPEPSVHMCMDLVPPTG